MYIKTIIIDGFKSYGQRTEIKGFDREFNAITGLNGSGKSNILDAICFVLGITNLVHVRAGSLQDLVYKSGQAGITKASVTLVFDNHNKSHSPIGYEQHDEIAVTRQIVIGGKNKYLINGSTVQNKRVQDLFCSVQLNVNNPHFLIMQGRITKVLNMKPPEILAMIEEAAGTRMYENKKQAAQKTIEKKDSKLNELKNVVEEDINPKLQKLREERDQYLEYAKVSREKEHAERIFVAWQFTSSKENSQKAKTELENTHLKIEDVRQRIANGTEEAKLLDVVIAELQSMDSDESARLAALESEVQEHEKHEAKVVASQRAKKDGIKSEEKKKNQLEKSLREDEVALANKEAELQKVQGLFQSLKDMEQTDADALAEAQRKFQAVSAGLLAGDDGAESTLQDQLIAAKKNISSIETEAKQAEMQLKHCQTTLKEKEQEMKKTATDYQKDHKSLENMERELSTLKNELKKLNYEDGCLEQLQEQKRRLLMEIRNLREKVDTFEARHPQLNFRYRDPETNFRRSSVKGLVCKLFKVKDPKMATALETAAGGRLYNVIVDTEVTSKKLLQKGQLQHRTTIIPLNKIVGHTMNQQMVALAQQLVGRENVYPALSLIEYNAEVHPAMQWIFGQVFVCKDLNMAKQVTFHNQIMKKSVTLEGDVMDPAGTLSGGARSKSAPILTQLEGLHRDSEALAEQEEALARVDAQIQGLDKVAQRYANLKQQLELRTHEVELVRHRLQQTTHHQYQEEVNTLKATIAEMKEKVANSSKMIAEGEKKVKELETKVKDAKSIRDRELKNAENEMNCLKKKAETSRDQWKQREQEFETLKLEITELKNSIENGKKQIAETEKTISQLRDQILECEKEVNDARAKVQEVQSALKIHKKEILKKNVKIQETVAKQEKIMKDNGDAELEIKKLEHEVSKLKSEVKDCEQRVSQLIKSHDWLTSDRDYFVQVLGNQEHDPRELQKRVAKLQEVMDKLGRNINVQAVNNMNKEEEQYKDLLYKKTIVENDKTKIETVISELDKKKQQALRHASEQVNKDFGSIFSSLLPGAKACLRPPEGMDVLDGLEVKVGFGDVWKEGLGELSGGQRSLVALSLILAMLLFKPAPIYILDEVDAALDLSHTQNIGSMLKSHFKASQFIVVSLKDGMFNNANVLFRTKFVDGMSTVSRTEQGSSSRRLSDASAAKPRRDRGRQ